MSGNPGAVRTGAFVLGALALTVAAVVVLGSGALFKQTQEYVLYFDGSIQGLSEGSPVVFRGVKVGRVKDILLEADLRDSSVKIPVIIEIEPRRMILRNKEAIQGDPLADLVDKGLRGQLLPQSLVTGQYLVHLDFLPETPVRLADTDGEYQEIPTVASPLERFSKTLQTLPLNELVNEFHQTLTGIRRIVEAPETERALAALADILEQADGRLGPLADETTAALADIRGAAQGIGRELPPLLVEARDAVGRFGGLSGEIKAALGEARGLLASGRGALRKADDVLDEDSPLQARLRRTLGELDSMSRSMRQLADFLKRHPEALLRGRDNAGD